MDVLYEMWLHAICDFKPELVAKIAPMFEKKSETFSSPETDLFMLRDIGISGEFARRFTEPEFFKRATDIVEYCQNSEIRIITRESEEYPKYLLNTECAPRLLFAKGEYLDVNDKISVSVVGCRKPTDQGKVIARGLGRNLAENGIVSVSGMAEGIDAEMHWGTIESGGKTIAVLAGSVDKIYPKSNEKLYYEILKNGTVISERPPGTVTKKYFYHQRNRIIIGITRGTVFVEGKECSGTSITARLATENNRDVFAVPGNPLNWQSEITNRLISEGAVVVNNLDTPAEYYKKQYPELFKSIGTRRIPDVGAKEHFMNGDEHILNYLTEKGVSVGIDEIAEGLGVQINVLSGRLTILCIKGYIRQESGNRYIIVKK